MFLFYEENVVFLIMFKLVLGNMFLSLNREKKKLDNAVMSGPQPLPGVCCGLGGGGAGRHTGPRSCPQADHN